MEQAKTLIVPLKEGLQYSVNGEFETTNELIFKAPAYAQADYMFNLQQYLVRGFSAIPQQNLPDDAPQEVEKSSTADLTEEEQKAMAGQIKFVLMNGPDDFPVILKAFTKLAPMVCEVDADVNLKKALIQNINPYEWGDIMCKYMAFFVMPLMDSD